MFGFRFGRAAPSPQVANVIIQQPAYVIQAPYAQPQYVQQHPQQPAVQMMQPQPQQQQQQQQQPARPVTADHSVSVSNQEVASPTLQRVRQLEQQSSAMYKIARITPRSLYKTDSLRWNSASGPLCANNQCNRDNTVKQLVHFSMELDAIIAHLNTSGRALMADESFMSEFVVCCQRIQQLGEKLRTYQPAHGIWCCLAKAAYDGDELVQQAAEEMLEKTSSVDASFSLKINLTGNAAYQGSTGGMTSVDTVAKTVLREEGTQVIVHKRGATEDSTPSKPNPPPYSPDTRATPQ